MAGPPCENESLNRGPPISVRPILRRAFPHLFLVVISVFPCEFYFRLLRLGFMNESCSTRRARMGVVPIQKSLFLNEVFPQFYWNSLREPPACCRPEACPRRSQLSAKSPHKLNSA